MTQRIHSKTVSAVLFALLFTVSVNAQSGRPSIAQVDDTEAAKWREDLRHMAAAMPKRHKNLFHTMTEAQFDSAVKSLDDGSMLTVLLTVAVGLGTNSAGASDAQAPEFRNSAGNFELQKVAEGVYAAIRKEPPGLMFNANSVFIINDEDVIVVDTNMTLSSAKEVLAALRKLTDKPNLSDARQIEELVKEAPEIQVMEPGVLTFLDAHLAFLNRARNRFGV